MAEERERLRAQLRESFSKLTGAVVIQSSDTILQVVCDKIALKADGELVSFTIDGHEIPLEATQGIEIRIAPGNFIQFRVNMGNAGVSVKISDDELAQRMAARAKRRQ